jgi:hypothetical protein
MDALAFADLTMPAPDSPDLPGQAGLPASVVLPAFMDAPRFADPPALPPDHAVPWSLANASADWDPHDPLSLPDSHGQPAAPATGPPAARPARRGRVLAAAAVVVLAAAAALLVISHHPESSAQAQSLGQAPARAGASAGQAQQPGQGQPGTGSKTAGPGAAGSTTSKTQPAADGSGQPGSSTSAGSSASPGPQPSPGPSTGGTGGGAPGGPPPPAGYKWQEISAASAGATAGFKIAIPVAWQMRADGLQTYFYPPAGSAYIEADLASFAYAKPARQVLYLQAQAKADHAYDLYALVAIRSASFRGVPEASWRFHWQETGVGRIAVLQTLFTLPTSAGKQSYDLTESAPALTFPVVNTIFGQALRTFTPLP